LKATRRAVPRCGMYRIDRSESLTRFRRIYPPAILRPTVRPGMLTGRVVIPSMGFTFQPTGPAPRPRPERSRMIGKRNGTPTPRPLPLELRWDSQRQPLPARWVVPEGNRPPTTRHRSPAVSPLDFCGRMRQVCEDVADRCEALRHVHMPSVLLTF